MLLYVAQVNVFKNVVSVIVHLNSVYISRIEFKLCAFSLWSVELWLELKGKAMLIIRKPAPDDCLMQLLIDHRFDVYSGFYSYTWWVQLAPSQKHGGDF